MNKIPAARSAPDAALADDRPCDCRPALQCAVAAAAILFQMHSWMLSPIACGLRWGTALCLSRPRAEGDEFSIKREWAERRHRALWPVLGSFRRREEAARHREALYPGRARARSKNQYLGRLRR